MSVLIKNYNCSTEQKGVLTMGDMYVREQKTEDKTHQKENKRRLLNWHITRQMLFPLKLNKEKQIYFRVGRKRENAND